MPNIIFCWKLRLLEEFDRSHEGICVKEVTGSPPLVPTAYLRLVPMSWLRQPNTCATISFLSARLLSCWLGELSQGSPRAQTKHSRRTEARPSTQGHRQQKAKNSYINSVVARNVPLSTSLWCKMPLNSDHKRAEPLTDASLQVSQHPAPNKHPMQCRWSHISELICARHCSATCKLLAS